MTEPRLMLTCGHIANAVRYFDKERTEALPCCAICSCTTPAEDQSYHLGRKARCCGVKSERSSMERDKLAFYEYRGPGSQFAVEGCTCGFARMAHKGEETRPQVRRACIKKNGELKFVERGPHEYDSYYCGCRGWD
jgi:hypothetical protein